MKYLLVLLVVVVAAWVMFGRSRGRGGKAGGPAAPGAGTGMGGDAAGSRRTDKSAAPGAAQTMVACAHCGLHLPRADTVADAQGRIFCDDAHRLAGPH